MVVVDAYSSPELQGVPLLHMLLCQSAFAKRSASELLSNFSIQTLLFANAMKGAACRGIRFCHVEHHALLLARTSPGHVLVQIKKITQTTAGRILMTLIRNATSSRIHTAPLTAKRCNGSPPACLWLACLPPFQQDGSPRSMDGSCPCWWQASSLMSASSSWQLLNISRECRFFHMPVLIAVHVQSF